MALHSRDVFSQFLLFCKPYLQEKKSTDLIKLLEKRFADCSNEFKSSADFLDLTEISKAKIESDSKNIFIHLRDYTKELKCKKRKREDDNDTPSPKSIKLEDSDSDDKPLHEKCLQDMTVSDCITIDDSDDDLSDPKTNNVQQETEDKQQIKNHSSKSQQHCNKLKLVKKRENTMEQDKNPSAIQTGSKHNHDYDLPDVITKGKIQACGNHKEVTQGASGPKYLTAKPFCKIEIVIVDDDNNGKEDIRVTEKEEEIDKHCFTEDKMDVDHLTLNKCPKRNKRLISQDKKEQTDNPAENKSSKYQEKTSIYNTQEEISKMDIEDVSSIGIIEKKTFAGNMQKKTSSENIHKETSSENIHKETSSENIHKETNSINIQVDTSLENIQEKSTLDNIPEETSLENNEEKTTSENIAEETSLENNEEKTTSENIAEETSLENNEEKTTSENIAEETSLENNEEKTTSENIAEETSLENNEEKTTSENIAEETSLENNEEKTTSENIAEETSLENNEEKTTSENIAEETSLENNEEKTTSENIAEETSLENNEEKTTSENIAEETSLENIEEKTTSENIAEETTSGNIQTETENIQIDSSSENIQKETALENSGLGTNEVKHKTGSKKQIARLEKLLEDIRNKIEELKEKELTIDDMDDECSPYILEEKYQQKFVKVWKKLCELRKESAVTGRPSEKRFRYSGTRYPEINRKIEKFVNKRKQFPDYHDIHSIITVINQSKKIGLGSTAIERLAREAFLDVGESLQKRRLTDLKYTSAGHITNSERQIGDPALNDPELKKKLSNNKRLNREKMDQVLSQFSEKQYNGDDKEDDVNSEEEEEEGGTSKESGEEDVPELTTILEERRSPILENLTKVSEKNCKDGHIVDVWEGKEIFNSNECNELETFVIETDNAESGQDGEVLTSVDIETDNAESGQDGESITSVDINHLSEVEDKNKNDSQISTGEKTSGDENPNGSPAVLWETDEDDFNTTVVNEVTVCVMDSHKSKCLKTVLDETTTYPSTETKHDDTAPFLYIAEKIEEKLLNDDKDVELACKRSVRILTGDDDLFAMSGVEQLSESDESNTGDGVQIDLEYSQKVKLSCKSSFNSSLEDNTTDQSIKCNETTTCRQQFPSKASRNHCTSKECDGTVLSSMPRITKETGSNITSNDSVESLSQEDLIELSLNESSMDNEKSIEEVTNGKERSDSQSSFIKIVGVTSIELDDYNSDHSDTLHSKVECNLSHSAFHHKTKSSSKKHDKKHNLDIDEPSECIYVDEVTSTSKTDTSTPSSVDNNSFLDKENWKSDIIQKALSKVKFSLSKKSKHHDDDEDDIQIIPDDRNVTQNSDNVIVLSDSD